MSTTTDTVNSKATGGQLSFRVALSAIRRYPVVFVAILVLAGVTAGLVWTFLPTPKYTGSVVFRIMHQGPRVISPTLENAVDGGSYSKRQAVTIKQRFVLNEVLNDPEAKKVATLGQQTKPLEWLESNLNVDFRGGAEYMRVYLEGNHPEEILAVLKALSNAYMSHIQKENELQRKERLQTLDSTHIQDEIKSKQRRIDIIAQTLKTTDGATLALIDSLLHDELRTARKELLDLQQQMEFVKAELPSPDEPAQPVTIPPPLIEEALRNDSSMVVIEAKLAAAKQTLADIESRFEKGTSNPPILKARGEVKIAEEKRDAFQKERRGQLSELLVKQYVEDQNKERLKFRERMAQLERRKGVLDAQLREIIERINQHGLHRVELDKLRKEIGHQEKLITAMSEEKERIRVEERAPNRITIQEDPYVVEGAEGSRRLKFSSLAGGGLFLLGFAILVRWEHRARRVNTAEELVIALNLPLLGTLPSIASSNSHTRGELVEAIDSTRTMILHCRTPDSPLRTIMISSALPGEGKTTLSGHLAISLARAGFRTILVDGDMHRRSISALFEHEESAGLCEVLRGEAAMEDLIVSTKVLGLSLLPAGKWSLLARQALVADRWSDIRHRLESEYDFVVVDTGPFLLLTDAQLLARSSDGVILSSLLNFSRFGAVVQTKNRLSVLGSRILGVVVHGVRSHYSGGYYSGYSYYRNGSRTAVEEESIALEKADA